MSLLITSGCEAAYKLIIPPPMEWPISENLDSLKWLDTRRMYWIPSM